LFSSRNHFDAFPTVDRSWVFSFLPSPPCSFLNFYPRRRGFCSLPVLFLSAPFFVLFLPNFCRSEDPFLFVRSPSLPSQFLHSFVFFRRSSVNSLFVAPYCGLPFSSRFLFFSSLFEDLRRGVRRSVLLPPARHQHPPLSSFPPHVFLLWLLSSWPSLPVYVFLKCPTRTPSVPPGSMSASLPFFSRRFSVNSDSFCYSQASWL